MNGISYPKSYCLQHFMNDKLIIFSVQRNIQMILLTLYKQATLPKIILRA